MNGIPADGAEVTINSSFRGKEYVATYTTGSDGRFSFSEKTAFSLATIFLMRSNIFQSITIQYNHVIYLAWSTSKHEQADDPNLTKLLTSLTCELTNPETDHINQPDSIHMNIISGIANWPN